MRKKKCLDYPAPEGNVVLHGHNVNHERHQILDIRDHRGHVYRCVMTKDNFATWDYIDEKWIQTEADRLDYSDAQMTKEEKELIWKFARGQWRIKSEKRAAKEAKRESQMQYDFSQIPELPEHLNDWLERTYVKYLYYRKKGSKAHVMCPHCGAEYEFRFAGRWKDGEEPEKDMLGTCRTCGARGYWQPWGRVKNRRFYNYFWIFQEMLDGRLLARMWFYNWQSYGGYKDVIRSDEEMRIILEPGKVTKYYQLCNCYSGEAYWSTSNIGGYGNITAHSGELYPAWEMVIGQTSMRYCDISAWRKVFPYWQSESEAIIQALMTHAKYPQTEFLLKAGATMLARQIKEGWTGGLNRKGKTPAEFLRLDTQRARELIRENGTMRELEVLQLEASLGEHWTEKERGTVRELASYMARKEILELFEIMSPRKLTNRTEKYSHEYNGSHWQTLRELRDYLAIRKGLGYDMTNSVYLNPKSLREAHQEMVEERERRRNETFIQEKLAQYPRIRENFPRLRRKYKWEHDGLFIRPAKDAEEIIMEGRQQHHCVGGDTYLSKHDKGHSIILLLRQDDTPNMPYITVEIEGTQIRQWYGAHDKKPDKEKIDNWLEEYTTRLKAKTKATAKAAGQGVLMPA